MLFLCSLPVVLSCLVLAAHFLHQGNLVFMGVCLSMPLLLGAARVWSYRLLQAFLILGALEWLRTMAVLVDQRLTHGQPWVRLVIILGVVALFTLASSMVFRTATMRRRLTIPRFAEAPQTA